MNMNTLQTAIKPEHNTHAALRFITCGSVDDGKSTLIGRLLVDSRAVMQDQLASASKDGTADLALFTDGLVAEREQGITIDVAYRYFTTSKRKFIIGDAPGHEQYTRNMVTAASTADAAVVLVDATKLKWQSESPLTLLAQTKRHALLAKLLRVPSIIFAINKLDALDFDDTDTHAKIAFERINVALTAFANEININVTATVPISALKGYNVTKNKTQWCNYRGDCLLHILENLPATEAESDLPFTMSAQWVEKFSSSSDTSQGRRIFWGRVGSGIAHPGQSITIFPSGQHATIAQVLNCVRNTQDSLRAGHGCGIVLDREVDVSRGDWLIENKDGESTAIETSREIRATVAWMDDEPLVAGRIYQMMHGRRWIKAKVKRIAHRLDINTLTEVEDTQLLPNAIGVIELVLQEAIPIKSFNASRILGAAILVDTASNKTSGALLMI